jgi:hypothetical protein
MVRLSGTALYLLNLKEQDFQPLSRTARALFTPRMNTFFYSYPPIQDSGLYFLEVLVVLCDAFRPDKLIGNCVEDYWDGRNILTANNSFLLAATPTEKAFPRWVLRNNTQPFALPTRVQQRTCDPIPGDNGPCELRQDPVEIWRHRLYDWVGGTNWRSAYDLAGAPSAKICFVGASHSRGMTHFAKELLANVNGITVYHVDSRFPEDFSAQEIADNSCEYAVIEYGQWPASWVPAVPYNDARYRDAMSGVTTAIARARAKQSVQHSTSVA